MFVSYSTSNLNTSRNTSLNTSLNTSRHPQVPKISKYQISSKYVKVRSLWTSDMTGLHRLLDLSSFGIVLRVQSRTLLGFQALQFHLQIRADALVLDENARCTVRCCPSMPFLLGQYDPLLENRHLPITSNHHHPCANTLSTSPRQGLVPRSIPSSCRSRETLSALPPPDTWLRIRSNSSFTCIALNQTPQRSQGWTNVGGTKWIDEALTHEASR